jgi:tetratricopeptide (TPR) repeat protein
VTRYSRQDILRILQLGTRQLTAWEREGLFPRIDNGEMYSFEHLSRLRSLRELRSKRMSARSIRAQVEKMQRVAGMRNVLAETTTVSQGSRLAFRHGGALLEIATQQLAFDFAAAAGDGPQLRLVRGGTQPGPLRLHPDQSPADEAAALQNLFIRAVHLEERPATLPEAIEVYREILLRKQDHAAACINLGTIHYNARDFSQAEAMYRRATEADPGYALAFFDLGNVLDEMQYLEQAIVAYRRAIELVPAYADAHYNLALALERQGERRKALRHWMAYVRLDPLGPWGAHALGQARKILAMEKLSVVSRSGCRASA